MGFSQALSGVNAASKQLDVVGNNIANAQTSGFKSSSVQFADVYAGAKTGLGTSVSGVLQNFGNGSIESTSRNLDLAIDGGGFFRFTQNGEVGYSRNGQLTMTSEGYLQNAQGALLSGYNVANFNQPGVDSSVPTGGLPETIQLPADAMLAKATSTASAGFSLDSSDEAMDPAAFNPTDSSTYNYSASSTIFDSQGNSYNLQNYFIKDDSAANTWQVQSRVALGDNNTLLKSIDGTGDDPGGINDAASASDGGNGTYTSTDGKYVATVTGAEAIKDGSGTITGYQGGQIRYQAVLEPATLTFGSSGQLSAVDSAEVSGNAVEYNFEPSNGASSMTFSYDFSGSTQSAQSYAMNTPLQNGNAPGELIGISIGNDGTIQGNYSNEKSIALGSVAMANFRNPEGLKPNGGNLWTETAASGGAVVGTAGTGQFGQIQSGALEASNVDLTSELVDLIMAQRNFQANTNSIRTQSEVLDSVVQLR